MNPPQLVERSRLFDLTHVDHVRDDSQVIDALLAVAAADRSLPRALFTDHDYFLDQAVRHREVLAGDYLMPMPQLDVLERVSDKVTFLATCAELGIPVPATVVVDMAGEGFAAVALSTIEYPVVVKPASSTEYLGVQFEGKRKVYVAHDSAELAAVAQILAAAGITGRFLVQEFIPGDDTQARLVTFYVDSSGRLTLAATAQVLAEEHGPRTAGLALAVSSYPDRQLVDYAAAFVERVGYTGFGSFDVKVDPRTGEPKFLELNPRTGRSSYFVAAAGVNMVEVMADDLVGGMRRELVIPERRVVYSVLPERLLLREVPAPVRADVRATIGTGGLVNPWKYRGDRSPSRLAYLAATDVNHWRKAGR